MIPLCSQQTYMPYLAAWQPHSYYHGEDVQKFSSPPSNIVLDGKTIPARSDYMTWDGSTNTFQSASLGPYQGGTNIPNNDMLYPTWPTVYSQDWHNSWQLCNEGPHSLSSTSNQVPSLPSLEPQPNISQMSGGNCSNSTCGCGKFTLDVTKCLGYGFRGGPGEYCVCDHEKQDHTESGVEGGSKEGPWASPQALKTQSTASPTPELNDYPLSNAADERFVSREADVYASSLQQADEQVDGTLECEADGYAGSGPISILGGKYIQKERRHTRKREAQGARQQQQKDLQKQLDNAPAEFYTMKQRNEELERENAILRSRLNQVPTAVADATEDDSFSKRQGQPKSSPLTDPRPYHFGSDKHFTEYGFIPPRHIYSEAAATSRQMLEIETVLKHHAGAVDNSLTTSPVRYHADKDVSQVSNSNSSKDLEPSFQSQKRRKSKHNHTGVSNESW